MIRVDKYPGIKVFTLLCLLIISVVQAGSDEETQKLFHELQQAKQAFRSAESELQRTVDNRWSQRQRQVEQKESLQRESENLQSDVEQVYTHIARLREEIILRENARNTMRAELAKAEEKYRWIGKTLDGILRKEEQVVRASFPLGQQERSLRLQKISHDSYRGMKRSPQRRLDEFQRYLMENIQMLSTVELQRTTVLLDNASPQDLTLIRFGHVFAMGQNSKGETFYLGQGASSAGGAFSWISLADPVASAAFKKAFPTWMQQTKVEHDILVDVLQNKYSEELLSAQEQSFAQKARTFLLAGGVVMIPLALLLLWALFLTLNRIVVFSLQHSRGHRFIVKTVKALDEKQTEELNHLAKPSKAVLPRILRTCMDHASWSRAVAEKAVKELLLSEVPRLDRHLDTLAVIAGTAPLLGLLGTVTGMISMFESITRFGTGDPKLLAGGISEALVTTEVGLAIAIPGLLMHNLLRNRRNHIQADMEMYAMKILNRLWPEA